MFRLTSRTGEPQALPTGDWSDPRGTSEYDAGVRQELAAWQREMSKEPGLLNRTARRVQSKLNSCIPEAVHSTLTTVIRQMVETVLTGSYYTSPAPLIDASLAQREASVLAKIDTYRRTAATEGGITGAGGLFLGLADFPLLLGIKLKMLFDIAALYGVSTQDRSERLYLLHTFQLAFSSDAHRRRVYLQMVDWADEPPRAPTRSDDPTRNENFDWRTFQQEYRDYIDLAKLAQLLPVIGAPVGIVVNHRLVRKLGVTAMNAYRMRWFARQGFPQLKED